MSKNKLVICEKPSVAQSIAAVLNAKKRGDGFLEGDGFIVSWCFGHLVELAAADSYGEQYKRWTREVLPILPEHWQYATTQDKAKQLSVLRDLMKRADVDSVVCATDAGREGELIFRLVYNHCKCKKPIQRLWISSMEDSAIRDGFAHLRSGAEYDNLYRSALCRSQADWLVGINATRLFSCLYGITLNVGRVQSPTLRETIDRTRTSESIYENAAEFWSNLKEVSVSIDAALEVGGKYIGAKSRIECSAKEIQFCRELFTEMQKETAGAADPSKLVYPYGYAEANEHGETSQYNVSRHQNTLCARAVDDAIHNSRYRPNLYNFDLAAMKVIHEFGFDRLNMVLAKNIQALTTDRSDKNIRWAKGFTIPEDSFNGAVIESNQSFLSHFATSACRLYESLGADRSAPNLAATSEDERIAMAAAYIVEISARETTSGNYVIYTGDIPADIISPELFTKNIDSIAKALQEYGAVLDAEVSADGSIDVVMGLDYCPNYEVMPGEEEEYPDDRQIFDPLATKGENLPTAAAVIPELNESERNFADWMAVTESSRYKWVEDEIYRLNGCGAMYYMGGEDGVYMRIHKDGTLEAGNYEGAIPHIGEAMFNPVVTEPFASFSEAYKTAMEAGGKRFMVDMFSGSDPQPLFRVTGRGAPEEKQSVLKQIREAEKTPKQPRRDKSPDQRKNKSDAEH